MAIGLMSEIHSYHRFPICVCKKFVCSGVFRHGDLVSGIEGAVACGGAACQSTFSVDSVENSPFGSVAIDLPCVLGALVVIVHQCCPFTWTFGRDCLFTSR